MDNKDNLDILIDVLLNKDNIKDILQTYLNNKNKIHPSIIYILLLNKKYDLINLCKQYGFFPDKNCISISCKYADYEMLNICISENNMPTNDDINWLIGYSIKHYVNQNYSHYYWQDYLHDSVIFDENKFYDIHIKTRIESINNKYLDPKENTYFYEIFVKFIKNIKQINYSFTQKEKKEKQNQVAKCLNLILSNNYIMISNNWEKFIKSEIRITKIIDNGNYIGYTRVLCGIGSYYKIQRIGGKKNIGVEEHYDVINIIRKNKLKLDIICLENAKKQKYVELVEFIEKQL